MFRLRHFLCGKYHGMSGLQSIGPAMSPVRRHGPLSSKQGRQKHLHFELLVLQGLE
jgi:hypothetical protein